MLYMMYYGSVSPKFWVFKSIKKQPHKKRKMLSLPTFVISGFKKALVPAPPWCTSLICRARWWCSCWRNAVSSKPLWCLPHLVPWEWQGEYVTFEIVNTARFLSVQTYIDFGILSMSWNGIHGLRTSCAGRNTHSLLVGEKHQASFCHQPMKAQEMASCSKCPSLSDLLTETGSTRGFVLM